jgi:uncharacterized membrane protein
MLKFMMAMGVIWWIVIAVWFVRLGLGLDHLSKDQILPGSSAASAAGGPRGTTCRG